MRTDIKKLSKYIKLTLLMSFISTIVLMLVPFAINKDGNNMGLLIVVPIVFWLFLFAEQYFVIMTTKSRKNVLKKYNVNAKTKFRIGLLSFYSTKQGKNIDTILLITLLIYFILTILRIDEMFLTCLLLTIIVFSFRCHCIFNGKNFRYIKILKGEVRTNEKNT